MLAETSEVMVPITTYWADVRVFVENQVLGIYISQYIVSLALEWTRFTGPHSTSLSSRSSYRHDSKLQTKNRIR
jgi:hypothetical protein